MDGEWPIVAASKVKAGNGNNGPFHFMALVDVKKDLYRKKILERFKWIIDFGLEFHLSKLIA